MRLCANENIPEICVVQLRQAGHDVIWVREESPGISDSEVLKLAFSQGRLLLTFDKDFGELVFRGGASCSHGIVLFRISRATPSKLAEQMVSVLDSRSDWQGQFSVVDDYIVRMRPLPSNEPS